MATPDEAHLTNGVGQVEYNQQTLRLGQYAVILACSRGKHCIT